MKLNQELIDTLQAIHDGKPWEYRYRFGDSLPWEAADNARISAVLLPGQGYEIRIKPEPKPETDPYAEAKAAWRDGELQYRSDINTWEDWTSHTAPLWTSGPSSYRRKPKPEPETDPYAEAKAAWRDGELQFLSDTLGWVDWPKHPSPQGTIPRWTLPASNYRRKPKPVRVPLGPEDVPPGSVFRHPQWEDQSYRVTTEVDPIGVHWFISYNTFQELMDGGWMINRSTPMTGKWDAAAWEPCWKEVQP